MADMLTIADPTVSPPAPVAVEIQADGLSGPMVPLGGLSRAFSGKPRSARRAGYREWRFTTGPLTEAELTTLRAFDDGSLQQCNGALMGNVNVDAFVTIESVDYVPDGDDDYKIFAHVILTKAAAG